MGYIDKATANVNEVIKHANVDESKNWSTVPVNRYPEGKSPLGVMDMAGNVREWQADFYDSDHSTVAWRGGS